MGAKNKNYILPEVINIMGSNGQWGQMANGVKWGTIDGLEQKSFL